MKVLKFGGSSVASAERIQSIVTILQQYKKNNDDFTVVFSAFGGVTDQLIEMSQMAQRGDNDYLILFDFFKTRHEEAIANLLDKNYQQTVKPTIEEGFYALENLLQGVFLVRELTKRTQDFILSFGERFSNFIISNALTQRGIISTYLDARKIIITNDNFGNAQVNLLKSNSLIVDYYKKDNTIKVVTGFIGSNSEGVTTTLGRGGSDYTTSILAAALQAESIEIWTDVNGIMTADPRRVKNAFSLDSMSYAEAMEMSHFGAKVIYAPTIVPALNSNIPILIKNTFKPQFKGTLVSANIGDDNLLIKGISSISKVALLTLEGSGLVGVKGIAGRLFSALATKEVNIILITQGSSEHSISFAVLPTDASVALSCVNEEFETQIEKGLISPVRLENNLSVIAIIGENMRSQPGISARLFQALGKNGINVIATAQGSSELNISVVIDRKNEVKALNAVHEGFFLDDGKVLHVYIIGLGLIGKTLLHQIEAHRVSLKENRNLTIKIIGIANSRKMLFNENGFEFKDDWFENFMEEGETMEIKSFLRKMKKLNLRNSVFIDNTASKSIPEYYYTILNSSISISTPNKIAASSAYYNYKLLKDTAKLRNIQYLYETNVGAGLPVIGTLKDLVDSGDQINKIEAVVSGSLSFIFNNFTQDKSFSSIVKRAQKLGYTEPDPRDDLSGLDVARKILILSRECNFKLDMDDIRISNILPKACLDAQTIDDFFIELEKADDHFSELILKAHSNNKALRFVAKLENGQASVGLEEVDETHPFYTLSGSDNMLVFTSERYNDRPLVVRGPGAGAEVTAAGVFSEIIRIAHYLAN